MTKVVKVFKSPLKEREREREVSAVQLFSLASYKLRVTLDAHNLSQFARLNAFSTQLHTVVDFMFT